MNDAVRETPIAEYSATAAALADLRTRYGTVVYDVSTTKGMQEAIAGRAEIRGYRIALEKKRVEIKAPALERCKLIDTEAKRITAELEALEEPIDAVIKREARRKEIEKEEAAQRERERVAAINARVDAIKALALGILGKSVEFIQAKILEAEAVDPETFPEELRPAVKYQREIVIGELYEALDARKEADAEKARQIAEREELARLRAEQETRQREQAEIERKAAADREAADRAARTERENLAAAAALKAQAEARAIREKAEAEARAEREREDRERAERQRVEAEARAKLEAEQKAEAERLRIERERIDAEKAEAQRAERERAIAEATLFDAAREALNLLRDLGQSKHLAFLKLSAALNREVAQGDRKAA